MLGSLSPLRLVLACSVGLLLALPWWFAQPPAAPVQVARAHRAPLEVRVATNGKVEPIDEAELEVRARLNGRIVYIPDPGTRVEAGAEILRIDGGPVAADLAAASSERLAVLESLPKATREAALQGERFATDRKLYEQSALTKARYLESKAELRSTEAHVAALEREVPLRVEALDLRIRELEEQLRSATVKAPFAGVVYKSSAEAGQFARVGDPILWIADLNRLRVRANIDQVDLGRVAPGQEVSIVSNAFPGRTWTARIGELVPHVFFRENRSISEALAPVIAATDGLVPGMTVDVEVVVAAVEGALQVPAEALFTREKASYVYRVDGKHLRMALVSVGLSNGADVEIVAGIEAGARVVIGPKQELHDGMRVEVQGEGSDSAALASP